MLTPTEFERDVARAGLEPIERIHCMEDDDGAYDVWKAVGVSDRILVHFDGHLDFNWITDRSADELLTAGSSEELDRLIAQVSVWNLDGRPLRTRVNITNFIYPAIKHGIVREFFWVIPDPFWATQPARQAIRQALQRKMRLWPPADFGPVTVSESGITLTVLRCPLTVCTLEHLPRFSETVLLDIDVDYFVTLRSEGPVPYHDPRPVAPWIWPSRFLERLKAAQLPTDLVTIAYSVNAGYTPLRYKYFGDHLREALRDPDGPVSDEPRAHTAAEAFREATCALDQGNVGVARDWWAKMVSRDPSYRTLHATPGWREETSRRWQSALSVHDRMREVDPEWHSPHLGRGRALWNLRRCDQAEEAFETACALSPGPTSATHWLGRCAYRRGQWESAYSFWMKSVEQDPEDARSWLGLAHLAARRGDWMGVIEHATRYLALGRETTSAHWLLAWAAWRTGQRRLCRRELKLWARELLLDVMAQGVQSWRRLARRTTRTETAETAKARSEANGSVV